jgi:hypothetical protein
VGLLNEVLEHLLGHFEVGDDAVLHGPNRLDVTRCLAEHILGFRADGLDPVRDPVDRDDRRFDDGDTASTNVHQGVGGSEVDCQVRGEQPQQAGDVHQ